STAAWIFSSQNSLQDIPNGRNETSGPQGQERGGTRLVRGRAGGRKRQHHAQAGADVRHPQDAGDQGNRYYRGGRGRGAAGRLRLSALAGRQLSAGSGRY